MNVPLLFCGIAFLIGSIPFGFIFTKFFAKKDIRNLGSGNTGATNVARVLGVWPFGVLTLLLDALKGVAAVILVFPSFYAIWIEKFHLPEFEWSMSGIWTVALFAVIGHCYSPWLKMKGGKGIATGLGAFVVLSPVSAAAGVLVFGWTFFITRVGSAASLCGMTAALIVHFLGRELSPELIPILALFLVILVRHEENIEALLKGSERQF